MYEHLGDLASSNDAIARIVSLPPITLNEEKLVFVGTDVVEPPRGNDCVRHSADSYQSLRTSLAPVTDCSHRKCLPIAYYC